MGQFVLLNNDIVNKLVTPKDARLLMEQILTSDRTHTVISNPPRMILNMDNTNGDTYQFRAGYLRQIDKIGLRIANLKNSETRTVLLIDAKSSEILALINESTTFRLRVGGTVANIIKYLSKPNDSIAALIGAGNVARGVCLGLDELRVLGEVKIFDSNDRVKDSFTKALGKEIQLKITSTSSIREATENADIVITATTANGPLVKYEWVKRGCLIISLGMGQELEPELVVNSNKIIVDDIEHCKAIGDIAYLMNNGLITENQIYGNLYEIMGGIKKGRENDLEIIVVVSQGMIAGDIALVHFVYEKALKEKVGKIIKTR